MNYTILGIYLKNRNANANEIQKLLTEYGCHIKTRLGLHSVDSSTCSPNGLILLELFGDPSKLQSLEDSLKKIQGVEVQKMAF